jgi:Pilus formation protein N terminal region
MSAVFVRRGLWLGLLAGALFAATAHAETVTVSVDQALVMKLPDKVATIVIGNPLIADASLQSGGMLVVTGKGYGGTNLVALDRDGRVLVDKYVQVLGPSGDNLVVVYKGIERESYSCAPECERRITLGDSAPYFASTLTQTTQRNGGAQTAR